MSDELVTVSNEEMAISSPTSPLQEMSFEDRLELAKGVVSYDSLWKLLQDQGQTTLDVCQMYFVDSAITDPATGELKDVVRTIFVCSDGSSYATTSENVYKQCGSILQIMGNPLNWDKPLPLTFEIATSNKGLNFINISL